MHCNNGPGYASPLDAMKNGPREKLLYTACVQPDQTRGKSDVLATVDVDPESPTYCQVIHRLRTGRPNDELHHSGWNICSSCHGKTGCAKRDKLILPALLSNRIFVVDVGKNPKAPFMYKVIEASEVNKTNCTALHTTHCLASGDIMISAMGDIDGNAKSEFVLVDSTNFTVKGTWVQGEGAKFNYDFWYQPYHDVMVSSEWGAPRVWKKGFSASEPGSTGQSLNFYSWSKRELIQTVDLGKEGAIPLEVRFLHNPKEAQGYVGCAMGSSIFRFYKKEDGTWAADNVIKVPQKKVSGWVSSHMGGLISDILISLDDRFLYFSNWLHGDVRQYDITDRANPKLTGQIFLGGKIVSDSGVKVLEDEELTEQPKPVYIKNKRFYGGPQMLQLSLDGKRLYVSTSLFSPWDKEIYPETIKEGGRIVKLDIDVENGGMKLDENFLVDFSEGSDGPLLPHEMRYPGGDCTSDIWLANEEN
ncbi:methanethiol oxidase isoform X2 [Anthonomus grandis grandis]|uniref:methanethiol oxidase isoform X2 n=1 Tax=Anthonomus grandis grandis TaxID=2921223 RepID=UPI0021667C1B|nr:methanethiol oxidase isoform X2 [Anthonomus grandis grandis]